MSQVWIQDLRTIRGKLTMNYRGVATRKEQETLNEKMLELLRLLGPPSAINFFYDHKWGPSWRVWYQNLHHHQKERSFDGQREYYDSAGCDLCVHGETLLDAVERLIETTKNDKTIREGPCREGCPHYEWDCY